ncbi:MAG: hypothetical protein NVS3B26_16620 [Mycobacteriales bacterium]
MPAPPYTLRVVTPDGTQLLSLGINPSTYILKKLELGFPTPRADTQALPGRDGEFDVTSRLGARVITAEVAVAQVNTGPLVDQLAALMYPGTRNYLYINRPDWGGERRIVAHGETFTCPAGTSRTAQMGFRCPSGLLEDVVQPSQNIAASGPISGGLILPQALPLVFSVGPVQGTAQVAVGGTVPAFPVIDIYGPCTNPVFRVVTTGAQIKLNVSINSGDFVRVDCGARTISLNGVASQSLYSQLDFATSTWLTLPLGTSSLIFSPATSSSPCMAALRWTQRWI